MGWNDTKGHTVWTVPAFPKVSWLHAEIPACHICPYTSICHWQIWRGLPNLINWCSTRRLQMASLALPKSGKMIPVGQHVDVAPIHLGVAGLVKPTQQSLLSQANGSSSKEKARAISQQWRLRFHFHLDVFDRSHRKMGDSSVELLRDLRGTLFVQSHLHGFPPLFTITGDLWRQGRERLTQMEKRRELQIKAPRQLGSQTQRTAI